MLGLVLDGAIAAVLLVAVGLGLRLQRSLTLLRSGDGELERLIVALDAATQRSAAALDGLKQAAATAEERLATVQRLVDDLQFLTSRGEQLADRTRGADPQRAAAGAATGAAGEGRAGGPAAAGRPDHRSRARLEHPAMRRSPARPGLASPKGSRRARGIVAVLMVAVGGLAVARLAVVVDGVIELLAADPAPLAENHAPPASPEPAWVALPEPAAGPEPPSAERDAAPADDRRPTAASPPDAAIPRLDPTRLTASEIALLHQLAARRAALEERSRELDQREALIETAAADLAEQIARLAALRTEIEAVVERHDAAEDAKLTSLVKIYETMKPKAAAEIFDRLEMPVLIRVVERMREAKSADVLARMDPVKAKQVTDRARQTQPAPRSPRPPRRRGATTARGRRLSAA